MIFNKKDNSHNQQEVRVLEQPLLSVLLPVYNASGFIPETLRCLLASEYTNIEVVCIDDGSKDDSLRILQEEAEKDSRIVVFTKENGGLSEARNTGIEHTRGEYLIFCDHDDIVPPSMYRRMMERALTYDCDIVTEGYINEYHLGTTKKHIRLAPGKRLLQTSAEVRSAFADLYADRALSTLWTTLYRVSLIKENSLKLFKEYDAVGEDLFFNLSLFPHVKCFYVGDETEYIHVFHSTNASIRYLPYRFGALLDIQKLCAEMTAEYSPQKTQLMQGLFFKELMTCCVFELIPSNPKGKKEKLAFFKQIKPYFTKLRAAPEWPTVSRLTLFLYKYLPSALCYAMTVPLAVMRFRLEFYFRRVYYLLTDRQR